MLSRVLNVLFYIHKTDDNKYTSSMFQYPTYLYLVLYSSTTREKDVVFREDIFSFLKNVILWIL